MAQNLELKIKIDSVEEVTAILKNLIAEDKGLLYQKDIYYKFNKGLLKLRCVNGRYELIKYLRNETAERRWSNYELLKLEGADVEKYLSELFEIEVIVEKERHLYLYKNTRIHLDHVKDLGNYLELETIVVEGEDDAEERFDEIVGFLKLGKENEIRASYRDLKLIK